MENTKILSILKITHTSHNFSNTLKNNLCSSINKIYDKYKGFRFKWWKLIKRNLIGNNLTDEEKFNMIKIKRGL